MSSSLNYPYYFIDDILPNGIFFIFNSKSIKNTSMKLEIKLQDRYSRGELLLRTIFGWLYILLPHTFVLFFVSIWGGILKFIAFFSVLFTGRYPQSILFSNCTDNAVFNFLKR